MDYQTEDDASPHDSDVTTDCLNGAAFPEYQLTAASLTRHFVFEYFMSWYCFRGLRVMPMNICVGGYRLEDEGATRR